MSSLPTEEYEKDEFQKIIALIYGSNNNNNYDNNPYPNKNNFNNLPC